MSYVIAARCLYNLAGLSLGKKNLSLIRHNTDFQQDTHRIVLDPLKHGSNVVFALQVTFSCI